MENMENIDERIIECYDCEYEPTFDVDKFKYLVEKEKVPITNVDLYILNLANDTNEKIKCLLILLNNGTIKNFNFLLGHFKTL